MTGNVWEWCWDILHRRYRASMGMGWNATAYECEFSCNPHPGTFLANLPNTKSINYGFRVVRSIPVNSEKTGDERESKVFSSMDPNVALESRTFPSVKKKPETKVTPVVESGCGCNTSGLIGQKQLNKQRDIYQALVEIDEQRFGNQYLTDMFNKYTDRGIDLPSQRGFNYNAWKHIKFDE